MIRWIDEAGDECLKGVALLRLDFNTEDEWRMEATLPTILFLQERANKIVILSHRGRPSGSDESLSLKKDTARLAKYLDSAVTFIPHFRFDEIRKTIKKSSNGSIFLLENLRFMREEEENNRDFAKELAGLGDYYVNDAFAVSHREDASVCAIADFISLYGGLELKREIEELSRVMENPEHPLVIVLGGAKAHDKLGVMRKFDGDADKFLLGGAAANTFLSLRGIDVGQSLVDDCAVDMDFLNEAAKYSNLVLPVDWRKAEGRILDIGDKSIAIFSSEIRNAKTIIWSGPLGFIEKEEFSVGTRAIAEEIAKSSTEVKMAGGGETVMFIKKSGLDNGFSFLSTGGGAMLKYLSGDILPGITALEQKHDG